MRESPSSPRMFKNNILDLLSRSPWWSAPLIWVPVSAFLFRTGMGVPGALHVSRAIAVFFCGVVAWTLSEYILHRFVFHFVGRSKIAQRIHFYIHGVHHLWPNDRYRLVMPPAASAALSLPFGAFFYAIMGHESFFPFFSGYLIGYVLYECSHYAVHHSKMKWPWFKKLKRHHLQHHFSEHHREKHFGVSSPVWDFIFRTK